MSKKIGASTQKFIEVSDIVDDVVFFKNGDACSVIETSSVNFFLLSQDEQNARIYGYMGLINSLSFPIQILIVSRKIDMSSYISMLGERIQQVSSPRVQEHLTQYRSFIQELVSGGELLDKSLYVVVPFSRLELGPSAAKGGGSKKASYVKRVQEALSTKKSSVVEQIVRMGLSARVLPREELIKLYYELYNHETISLDFDSSDVKNVIL